MIKRGWKRKTLLTTESLIFNRVPPRIIFVHQAYRVSQSTKHQAQWSLRILPFRFSFFFFWQIFWVLSCSRCFTKLGKSKRWVRNVPAAIKEFTMMLCHPRSAETLSVSLDNFLIRHIQALFCLPLKPWRWTTWLLHALLDLTFCNSVKPRQKDLELGQGLMQKLGQEWVQIAMQAADVGKVWGRC